MGLQDVYHSGTTVTTKKKMDQPYVSFSVHESGGPIAAWTHGSQNSEIKNLLSALPAFLGTSMLLPLYPQEITRTQKMRTEIVPSLTYTDVYSPVGVVDSWGLSVPQWTIRGNSGWGMRTTFTPSGSASVDGYLLYVALINFFENYHKEQMHRMKKMQAPVSLLMCNSMDTFQDYWYVEPAALPSKSRTSDRPLVYSYELILTGVSQYVYEVSGQDSIIDALQRGEERIQRAADTIVAATTAINSQLSSLKQLSNNLHRSVNSIVGACNNIVAGLNSGKAGIKSVLGLIPDTLDKMTAASAGIRAALGNTPLSPLHSIPNSLRQIECALKTTQAVNSDFWNSLSSDLSSLKGIVKASGCGTTLKFTPSGFEVLS